MRRKTKDVYCVAAAGVVPRPLVQHKPTVSLQVDACRYFLDFEAFNASLLYVNVCAPPYLECVSQSYKIVTLLNKYPGLGFL